jgi:hypothetical protein
MERSDGMQRYLYMKPALQPSEAVLLPALSRSKWQDTVAVEWNAPLKNETFIPATEEWKGQTTALSTQVRPSGSMAGRSVLRAAGFGRRKERASAVAYRSLSAAQAARCCGAWRY